MLTRLKSAAGPAPGPGRRRRRGRPAAAAAARRGRRGLGDTHPPHAAAAGDAGMAGMQLAGLAQRHAGLRHDRADRAGAGRRRAQPGLRVGHAADRAAAGGPARRQAIGCDTDAAALDCARENLQAAGLAALCAWSSGMPAPRRCPTPAWMYLRRPAVRPARRLAPPERGVLPARVRRGGPRGASQARAWCCSPTRCGCWSAWPSASPASGEPLEVLRVRSGGMTPAWRCFGAPTRGPAIEIAAHDWVRQASRCAAVPALPGAVCPHGGAQRAVGQLAEFQMAAPLLGVPHPTTYPLYMLLGKLATL